MVRELSSTRVAGISPATILQNRQSATQPILTCGRPARCQTYMVALLRTLGAAPAGAGALGPLVTGLLSLCSVAPGPLSVAAVAEGMPWAWGVGSGGRFAGERRLWADVRDRW
jgi:hypothetical protein